MCEALLATIKFTHSSAGAALRHPVKIRRTQPASFSTLVPLISDRWGKKSRWHGGSDMPENERQQLHEIVRIAHARGQRVRFWATPEDPACWRELTAAGVDLIGTDRLGDLARFLEEQPGQ
ncbi:MAG: hypothetical protein ISQ70_07545 [Pirellulales bacterium]|nr:hypothetical protein [Pirellulales bacterium]